MTDSTWAQQMLDLNETLRSGWTKEGSRYSGVLKGAIKTSASSSEETTRAKEKIKVLSTAAAHPSPPTSLHREKYPHHWLWSVMKRFGEKGQSRATHPVRTSPITTRVRADPILPHAIIWVRLVVFHPHIILLGGGSPFFWGFGIGSREHVLGNVGGWRADECKSEAAPFFLPL